jgi:(S)-2-hydroxy-acid oxidase
MTNPDPTSRRRFLSFLAASPLVAAGGVDLGSLTALIGGSRRDQNNALGLLQQAAQEPAVIGAASEALNVFDFEPAAKAKIPIAHWGYLMTGHRRRRHDSRESRRFHALRPSRAAAR